MPESARSLWLILGACILLLSAACLDQTNASEAQASNPVFTERQEERTKMVETQMKGAQRIEVTDKAVLQAMLKVPRHLFVPEAMRALAYNDSPLPIGHGQTISQPYIVALMTQALELTPEMKVLEVGTGSGYQAAILSEVTSHVFTIEILKPLYEGARDRLKQLGFDSVIVRLGDGYYGLQEFAPFDRIIVTCAAQHVPPPLFDQLKPGGRMVIPVGGPFETQRLLVVAKDETGGRSSKTVEFVRFVPLIRGPEPK
jgi:protein-L-isoaspartate(D-aspartate) O-methyltransferase